MTQILNMWITALCLKLMQTTTESRITRKNNYEGKVMLTSSLERVSVSEGQTHVSFYQHQKGNLQLVHSLEISLHICMYQCSTPGHEITKVFDIRNDNGGQNPHSTPPHPNKGGMGVGTINIGISLVLYTLQTFRLYRLHKLYE